MSAAKHDGTTKRRAAVYREAARAVAEREVTCSCDAVSLTDNFNAGRRHWGCRESANARRYAALFAPNGRETAELIWGEAWSEDFVEQQSCRVIALCFMAAITERP
jgi:hypothetical protein